MSDQNEVLNQAFIIIVDDTGVIQKGSSGTSKLLGIEANKLAGTNLINYLPIQSQFLLTDIIVNSNLGEPLEKQPVFLYTAARVIKGFSVEGKNIYVEQEDYEELDGLDALDEYGEYHHAIHYSLMFKYDDNLTKNVSPLSQKDGFTKGASEIISQTEHKLDMTFVSIGDVKAIGEIEGMSITAQKEFIDKIEAKLGEESLDGAASCQLEDGKYALLHRSDSGFEHAETEIKEWVKSIDPEGKIIKVQTKSIDLDSSDLSDREIRNAIHHATEVFTGGDIDDVIFDTLSQSSNAYVDHALDRKRLLIDALEGEHLTAAYSAVVELKNWHCIHLWTKVRANFESDGLGTTEIRRLVEDDPELQARVDEDQCRIIAGDNWTREQSISLDFNIHSLDNISIIEKLLRIRKSLKTEKLIIRISGIEANNIKRLLSLETLKRAGLTLGLYGDELGAINPALLKGLPIDFIVVEFDYTRNTDSLKMAMPMLRSLQKLCKENGIKLIFKGIENHDVAIILAELEDVVATGRYFGTSVDDPDQLEYKPKADVQAVDPAEKLIETPSELFG